MKTLRRSIEHNGTVPVWWLVSPREMFDITKGGHLELVSEFEVSGGGYVDPHNHPTHEFYYVTSGRGIMEIEGEEREIGQGDLVHIPPMAMHSLKPLSDTRADPLLLLRGRHARRRRDQLHRALTIASRRLVALGAATLGESGALRMDHRIKPAWSGATVAGPAMTAKCGRADNLAIHVAVARVTRPGAVLVVDATDPPEYGYWGEVLTTGAEARGIAGLGH